MSKSKPMLTAGEVVGAMVDSAKIRRLAVLKLKRDGNLTYQQVADQMGLSRQRVHAMCKRALKEQA